MFRKKKQSEDDIEYCSNKNGINIRKHGYKLSVAKEIFKDLKKITEQVCDEKSIHKENRFRTTGTGCGKVLDAIWTPRPTRKRVISVHKASARTRNKYNDQPK